MPRLHLFEIEDQSWCPRSLRDAVTDYLRFAFTIISPYSVIVPKLSAAVDSTGATQIADLCSGGGGPWKQLLPLLRRSSPEIRVTLTDLYPNSEAFEEMRKSCGVAYETTSVNATSPPAALPGFRTLFTGFHHFRPADARRILQSAVESGKGIAIFEFTERRPLAFLLMLPVPLFVLLTVPFIRPFRWSRLFWTVPLPFLPLLAMWDGLVSCARTYTPDELRSMTADFATYYWDIGTVPAPAGPGNVTHLIGIPAQGSQP